MWNLGQYWKKGSGQQLWEGKRKGKRERETEGEKERQGEGAGREGREREKYMHFCFSCAITLPIGKRVESIKYQTPQVGH